MKDPDFNNLLKVLERQIPTRPTIFEFFLNDKVYSSLAGIKPPEGNDRLQRYRFLITAFRNAGYDYTTVDGSNFGFPQSPPNWDRKSFDEYQWPDPDDYDYSALEKISPYLPKRMKLIVNGPGGVLENVINLVGYETLCFMLMEDAELTKDIFDAVGSRLLRHYEISSKFDTVGALISNDDWGYNTQTMLSPSDLRKYVFPWHKKIVEAIHTSGKPAILHSCGNLEKVMNDIIYDMKFDAKHSYEDKIIPVEEFYERWSGKIAVLGGIDVDFVCRSTPEQIRKRSLSMIERSAEKGGYALGTGNSVPEYMPYENYLAMISAVIR